MHDNTLALFAGIGALLLLASVIGRVLKWRAGPGPHAVIDNLNARINAWWVMVLVIGIAFVFVLCLARVHDPHAHPAQ